MVLPNIVGSLQENGAPAEWPKVMLDGRPYRKESCTWMPVFRNNNGTFNYFVVVPVNYFRDHNREDAEQTALEAFEEAAASKAQAGANDAEAEARAAERRSRLDMVIGNLNSEDSGDGEEEAEADNGDGLF